jgi:hypothetical protein
MKVWLKRPKNQWWIFGNLCGWFTRKESTAIVLWFRKKGRSSWWGLLISVFKIKTISEIVKVWNVSFVVVDVFKERYFWKVLRRQLTLFLVKNTKVIVLSRFPETKRPNRKWLFVFFTWSKLHVFLGIFKKISSLKTSTKNRILPRKHFLIFPKTRTNFRSPKTS